MFEKSIEVTKEVIGKELRKIIFDAISGIRPLSESVEFLKNHYGITDESSTPIEFARDAQSVYMDLADGVLSDEIRDTRIKALISRAIRVKDPVQTITVPSLFRDSSGE